MKKPKEKIILMTGGLDSYIIWRLEGQPPGLFFDFGHPSNKLERVALRKIEDYFGASYFRIIQKEDLSAYEMDQGYMPYRNLLLFLWASLEYPDVEILFGQVLEYLNDKNPRFYRVVERLAKQVGKRNLRISVPYKKYTKTQMVKKFLAVGYPASELTNLTYSCMSSVFPPCGLCSNCINRYIAFKNNGFEEELKEKPTRSNWIQQQKQKKSNFRLGNLLMYIKRWLEAESAFRIPDDLVRSTH